MNAITEWTQQITQAGSGIEEMYRIKKVKPQLKKEALSWINRYYKKFLLSGIIGLAKECNISKDELVEHYENFDDDAEYMDLT